MTPDAERLAAIQETHQIHAAPSTEEQTRVRRYCEGCWLLQQLADAEQRNLMSYCAWCGGEFPHPSRTAREEAIPAHALDCPKRPEAQLVEVLWGYERMLHEALAMLDLALAAEDPDEWAADGLTLVGRIRPIVDKIVAREVPPPGSPRGEARE